MKTPFTLILIALFYWNAYATIHTVNNSPDSAADYNNVQAAIDAATAGDTIYVAGSNVLYPNFNVDKQLTLFGSGYYSNGSEAPSRVNDISINASNSKVSGFRVERIQLPYDNLVNDLIITDNRVTTTLNLISGAGHLVEGNILTSSGISMNCFHSGSFRATSTIIRNNIIFGRLQGLSNAPSVVENNIFVKAASNNSHCYVNCGSFVASNNIYFGYSATGCGTCTHQFQLLYYYDSGTSAYVGSNPMFVNPATLSTNNITVYDPSQDWSLQAGSPAIGAGQFGYDLGAYGGLTPFVPGGYPPIPRITSLTSPSSQIEEGGTVQITIQAVSQQ